MIVPELSPRFEAGGYAMNASSGGRRPSFGSKRHCDVQDTMLGVGFLDYRRCPPV